MPSRPLASLLLALNLVGPAAAAPFVASVVQVATSSPKGVLQQVRKALLGSPRTELFVLPEGVCRDDALKKGDLPALFPDADRRERARTWLEAIPPCSALEGLFTARKKAVVYGALTREGAGLRSRMHFLDPGGPTRHAYDRVSVRPGKDLVAAGDRLAPFPTRFGSLGLLTADDLATPEAARTLALQGAEVLAVGARSPASLGKITMGARLTGTAVQAPCWVLLADQARSGHHAGLATSAIVGPDGGIRASVNGDRPGIASETVDPAQVAERRAGLPAPRAELYLPLLGEGDRPPPVSAEASAEDLVDMDVADEELDEKPLGTMKPAPKLRDESRRQRNLLPRSPSIPRSSGFLNDGAVPGDLRAHPEGQGGGGKDDYDPTNPDSATGTTGLH